MTTYASLPHTVRRLVIKHAAAARDFDSTHDPEAAYTFEDDEIGTIVVKRSSALSPVADALEAPQRLVGGPNPLTAMLVGGALSAGLGYGGGKLLETLLPRKYGRRGVLPRNLAIAGGLAGAAVPGYLLGRPAIANKGLGGLIDNSQYPQPSNTPARFDQAKQLAEDTFRMKVAGTEAYYKTADLTGASLRPIIPVDRFNRLIYSDPYTPAPIQAAAMGLTAAASASRGGASLVSPLDVARIAVGMGSGAVSGLLVGKVLGAMAGLTPAAQDGIQQAGVLAGLLTNIVPLAFSR